MKSYVLILGLSLIVINSAWAQESGQQDGHFSVAAGLGFFADNDNDGFSMNFEGSYHVDDLWSGGIDFQIGIEDSDTTILSVPIFGRYDFDSFPTDIAILKDLHAFAKLGMGLTYVEIDRGGSTRDDTDFLFVIGGGLAYPITDQIYLESRMQFNITPNDFFDDDYYFSWEMIGVRFHF
jgi:opacity protein-like surface antigen